MFTTGGDRWGPAETGVDWRTTGAHPGNASDLARYRPMEMIFTARIDPRCSTAEAGRRLQAHGSTRLLRVAGEQVVVEIEAGNQHQAFAELCAALPTRFQYSDLIVAPS